MRGSGCPGSVALGQAHHPGSHQDLRSVEEQGADFFSDHFIRKKLNYADQYQYHDGPQHSQNSLRMKNRCLRVDLKKTEFMLLGWGMISEIFLVMI